MFLKESPMRVKPLLYTYRTLLTGIHLMRTGWIETNLRVMNADARLEIIDDLIARKASGAEHETLDHADLTHYDALYDRLVTELEQAQVDSALRDSAPREAKIELNELVVRLRLATM
jgi:predicted nucleotidyltransferase